VATLSAGSKAEFTILRDGKKETLTATIAKRDQQVSSNETGPRSSAKPSGETTLGMNLAPVTPDARQEFGLDDNVKGVVVTSVAPDSDAAAKGLQAGDVIKSVGGKEVRTLADIRRQVADAKGAGRTTVLMLVGGIEGEHFVPVKIG
jgi:serine protease Do